MYKCVHFVFCHFCSPKTAEDKSNLLKESIPKTTVHKNKRPSKFSASGKLVEKLKFLYVILVEPLKITVHCTMSSH